MQKQLHRVMLCILTLVLLLGTVAIIAAQGEFRGTTISNLNARSGPGAEFPTLAVIPARQPVVIESRNQFGNWIIVHTLDRGMRGWVASRFVNFAEGVTLEILPISEEQLNVVAAPPPVNAVPATGSGIPAQVTAVPLVPGQRNGVLQEMFPDVQLYWSEERIPFDDMVGRLWNTPVLYNMSNDTMRELLRRGIARGGNPRRFTVVGDSVSAGQPFLTSFGSPVAYSLGPHSNLQAAINWFSVPVGPGEASSFVHVSYASRIGFTASAVFDPIWMNPAVCNDSPLICEYDLFRPSVAIIYFLSQDLALSDLATYRYSMQQIVYATLDRGIIPVLNLGAMDNDLNFEKTVRYNNYVLDLAQAYNLPVINFWVAAQPLENNGINAADPVHLTQPYEINDSFSFNGQEQVYGTTLRNLVTLQALDAIRALIIAPVVGG